MWRIFQYHAIFWIRRILHNFHQSLYVFYYSILAIHLDNFLIRIQCNFVRHILDSAIRRPPPKIKLSYKSRDNAIKISLFLGSIPRISTFRHIRRWRATPSPKERRQAERCAGSTPSTADAPLSGSPAAVCAKRRPSPQNCAISQIMQQRA